MPADTPVDGGDPLTAPVTDAPAAPLPEAGPPSWAAPLQTRCAAVLPKADAVIAQGNCAFSENENFLNMPGAEESQEHRFRLAQMERDLSYLRIQRVLIDADMGRLQWVQSREEMQRVSPPIQTHLRCLTASLKPVQVDLQVLKHTPRTVAFLPPVVSIHLPAARRPAPAPVTPPAPKAASSPHLSSPTSDEPQFSMPTGTP